jgi:hypothetical protein
MESQATPLQEFIAEIASSHFKTGKFCLILLAKSPLALGKTTKTGGFGRKTRNFYLPLVHFEQVTKDERI